MSTYIIVRLDSSCEMQNSKLHLVPTSDTISTSVTFTRFLIFSCPRLHITQLKLEWPFAIELKKFSTISRVQIDETIEVSASQFTLSKSYVIHKQRASLLRINKSENFAVIKANYLSIIFS